MACALYIHIPFCVRKCIYCDFLSVPLSKDRAERYVEALCTELSLVKDLAEPLKTVYIGGGTPTLLGTDDFRQIFDRLLRDYGFDTDIEITVEANPGTVSPELLGSLRSLGVNRLSIGVQSFQDSELKTLGRIHDSGEAMHAVSWAKAHGFRNISIDLMYGIPGQTREAWKDTLLRAVHLEPSHISSYELTPEKSTPLFGLLSAGKLKLPSEDLVLAMYGFAIDLLGTHGYRHYEISNFALPGHESRHNLNYWDHGEYIGIGAGAHSFTDSRRSFNTGDIERYITDLALMRLPEVDEQEVTPGEAIREIIFLGLRKTVGIPMTNPMLSGTGIPLIEASRELVDDGYLQITGDNLSLTRKGLVVSNTVIVQLMEALGL